MLTAFSVRKKTFSGGLGFVMCARHMQSLIQATYRYLCQSRHSKEGTLEQGLSAFLPSLISLPQPPRFGCFYHFYFVRGWKSQPPVLKPQFCQLFRLLRHWAGLGASTVLSPLLLWSTLTALPRPRLPDLTFSFRPHRKGSGAGNGRRQLWRLGGILPVRPCESTQYKGKHFWPQGFENETLLIKCLFLMFAGKLCCPCPLQEYKPTPYSLSR